MPFTPATITLDEAGPDAPYKWKMTKPLAWTGTFRGQPRHVEVPTSPEPFTTDLASVPRSLTWLFPRYGKYTKAAVLHDYLCQNFRKDPRSQTAQSLLPLKDRSDADELFRHVMAELDVPRLRRWLMWTAVSWATLFTSLVPGRRSRRALCWVGRFVALVALFAAGWLLFVRHDRTAVVACALGLPAALLLAATIALGRADRAVDAVVMYPITLFFSPLLVIGVALGLIIFVYLALEDLFRRLPATRRLLRDLFSEEAKMAKVATPQFARLAEVLQS
jgi:hypothetical protein